ncbi:MAG: type II secretion system GspH family protein [Deltaproteobacteria bacterium]|nr:type II secretion system GspH family protein [Deltaproteobacteria bacterium]
MDRFKGETGFTYIALLFAILIIGITLSSVGTYWSFIDQKAKEEDLLFRGDQFVRAIDGYYKSTHGKVNLYPEKIEDLIKDPRSLVPKRYLRKIYKDPFTGEADWIFIKDKKSGRIKGVKSRSEKIPVKEDGFPERYRHFEGKGSYSEWEFVHKPGIIK